MHSFEPPYSHNDIKPGNVLLEEKNPGNFAAVLMDFGSTRIARQKVDSRKKALEIQVHSTGSFPPFVFAVFRQHKRP